MKELQKNKKKKTKKKLLQLPLPLFGQHRLDRRQKPNERCLRHGLGHRILFLARVKAGDAGAEHVESPQGDDEGLERLLLFLCDSADPAPVPAVGGVDGREDDEGDGGLDWPFEERRAREGDDGVAVESRER